MPAGKSQLILDLMVPKEGVFRGVRREIFVSFLWVLYGVKLAKGRA